MKAVCEAKRTKTKGTVPRFIFETGTVLLFVNFIDHAARQSGTARRKPGTGFSAAITDAWARGIGTCPQTIMKDFFHTSSCSIFNAVNFSNRGS